MLLAQLEGHFEITIASSQLVGSGAVGADVIHASVIVEFNRLSLLRIQQVG